MSKSVIIIGGGLLGMLSAYYLQRAGAQVQIFDKGPFGQEASWAGGGILSPLYPWRYPEAVSELARQSQNLYPALLAELKAATGLDPEYQVSGMWMLNIDDADQAQSWADQYQRPLTLTSLARLPTTVTTTHTHAYLPDVAQVRNPRLIKTLLAALNQANVTLQAEQTVQALLFDQQRVVGIQTALGRHMADAVIVANGAWSGAWLEPMGITLPVTPVRGQMLLYQADPGLLSSIILQGPHYLIPRRDGHIVAGSTMESAGFDKQTTTAAFEHISTFATQLIPALADAPVVNHWAGLRPGCGDGIPYLDQHPEHPGLYFNVGHFRNGIVMAAASAYRLSRLITQGTDPGQAYRFDRRQPAN